MPHVQLNDFKMHYMECGAGPEAVVFVHGWVSTHRWWQATLDRLPPRLHAYAIDLRGAGESEQVEAGHTFQQYADDLQQLVEALGLERFTLVGHSMGGQIALQYALDHQDRLKAMVLVDPVAASGNKIDPGIVEWCKTVQGQPEGQRVIVQGAIPTPIASGLMDQLVADAAAWGPAIYNETLAEMARFNVAGRLGEIKVPTLVTWADKDTSVPFPSIAEIYSGIPGCGLEVWHGVGHSGPIEAPDRFAALLQQFMAEVTPPAAA
jgi:pimeloyl-ACP methyl ester carboxylesterase